MTGSLACFAVRLATTEQKTGRFDPLCADIEINGQQALSASEPDVVFQDHS